MLASPAAAAALAIAASFLVYTLPAPQENPAFVVWRNWGWYMRGIVRMMCRGLDTLPGGRAFLLLEVGLAVAVQAGAALLTFRMLRRPRPTRLVALLGLLGAGYFLAPRLAGSVIPSLVFNEADRAPERPLPKVCTFTGTFLPSFPIDRSPANVADTTPIVLGGSDGPAILRMPDCVVVPLFADSKMRPFGLTFGVNFVVPGGMLLYRMESRERRLRDERWYLPGPGGTPVELPDSAFNPYWWMLSNDGEWLVGIDRARPRTGNAPVVVGMKSLLTLQTRTVTLELPEGRPFLLALDTRADLLIVRLDGATRSASGYYAFNLEGSHLWGPEYLSGMREMSNHVRFVGGGWVAWDSAEGDVYPDHIGWSMPGGRGELRPLRGRLYHAVAVSADGRFIATSERKFSRFSHAAPWSVVVVDTRSRAEVYRRNFQADDHIEVRLPGTGFFAYTEDSGACGHVVRLPE
jgi:hypothetical protein